MKKMLQFSALMTMLVMASSSLFSMCDMKMEPMNVTCKSLVDMAGDRAVAYLEDAVQESLLKLHELYPQWGSELFKQLCKDLKSKANVLLHEQAVQVVDECAAFCDQELQKDVADKQALEVIKADLQDYQQFLASAKSCLSAQEQMMTKKKCCAPAVNCFNIAPYLPFLPTGPIIPVTSNFLYAYRQESPNVVVTIAPQLIPFTSVAQNDGNWSFNGSTDFTALTSGTFLISVSIPYQHSNSTAPAPVYLFLEPLLDTVVIPFSAAFYHDDYANAGSSRPNSFTVDAYFIASVSAGQILQFQDRIDAVAVNFFRIGDPSSGFAGSVNGSVTIVRIK